MSTPPVVEQPRVIAPVPFKFTLVDGSQHTVCVRQLDVIELYEFIEFANSNKTPDLVCLVTGKPKEFIRQIDVRTYSKLAAKCIELNFPEAMELMADPVAASMLIPLIARMRKAQEFGQAMSESVFAPAHSASLAATGNGSSETQSAG